MSEAETPPKKRGFGAMKPDRVREIASRGGKAAHAIGSAHEWTSEQARIQGRKGGKAFHQKRRRERAARIAAEEKDK
jgi:uncharacterized protein